MVFADGFAKSFGYQLRTPLCVHQSGVRFYFKFKCESQQSLKRQLRSDVFYLAGAKIYYQTETDKFSKVVLLLFLT